MIHVPLPPGTVFAGLAAVGVVAGLVVLIRGFGGYRAAGRISGTSVSRIASLAVGEVLVSGTAEAIELTLISPLQSIPCVYYRSRITETRDDNQRDLFKEDRAVGFRVRDASGAVRIFPNGARFDVPDRYDESTSSWSGGPVGLQPRTGPAYAPGPEDREAQIAALLTVKAPLNWSLLDRAGLPLAATGSQAHYREARIELGDTVTVVGRVLPFADLDDPSGANLVDGSGIDSADPEIAADLAEARAAGLLAPTPEEAWGNAAIEGFGIGKPVRTPELDPAADRPPPPDPTLAARAAAAFEIAPDALILATSEEVPMLISLGAPTQVAARAEGQFVLGLLGAALAIGSAMALAVMVQGGLK
ncbi:MAG TPA: hypothetical protein VHM48_06575 [Candidatus Limnocylindrales bacterium]|nr:hypothetical protein [Candidatus Limnocylindrales bacterium]